MSQGRPRHPAKVSARFITSNPGGIRDDYSDFAGAAADEASEAPSKDEQDQMTKEANERWAVLRAEENQRKKVRSLVGRLKTLAIEQSKAGEDPTDALEQAVTQLEKRRAS